MTDMTNDRFELWRSLLVLLTEAAPHWAVAGNVDEGLSGDGDIDLVAPAVDWPAVEQHFRDWAKAHGLSPVVACTHRPGVLELVALGAGDKPVHQVEVLGFRHFRGARLYRAEDLSSAMEMDARGWRRLRPGAAGVVKLLPNGVTWSGGLKWSGPKAQRVLALLKTDPEGVRAGADAFGLVRGLVVTAALRAGQGRWSRWRMSLIGLWALANGLCHPHSFLDRAGFRLRRDRCELLATVKNQELVRRDPQAWLARVAAEHEVAATLSGG
ncbi:MAG: hypothetical protein M3454_09310 [Actinomycetota bacterium]|nr:hypothetical protein [Actinomycetota bacterium]